MKKKVNVYRLFADDRKQNNIGWLLVRADPKGGPYESRWVDNDGVVHSSGFPNTHAASKIVDGNKVPPVYLHRRCKPCRDTLMWANLPGIDEAMAQLGALGDNSQFSEQSPIKMGEIYMPAN